jgi:hypothetical protein
MRRVAKLGALVIALVTATLVHSGIAQGYAAKGYDVSWPQCGVHLPSDGAFGIVGVNGGRPYDINECLGPQFDWAKAHGVPAFYINTSNPGARSRLAPWYTISPNAACSPQNETACAYNYGYNGAVHAWEYAQRATGASAQYSWWLDVETTNTWSRDQGLNTAVILGAAAFLRSMGVPVGVYSTDYQWDVITGTAQMDLYNWHAGARDASQAARWCVPSSTFSGGPLILVQWVEHDLDHNHACAPLPVRTAAPVDNEQTPGLHLIVDDLLNGNHGRIWKDLFPGPPIIDVGLPK